MGGSLTVFFTSLALQDVYPSHAFPGDMSPSPPAPLALPLLESHLVS